MDTQKMATQNDTAKQSSTGAVIKPTKSGNALAKIIGLLMVAAIAGGAYFYFQSKSENEKKRDELLQTSELIGNNAESTTNAQEGEDDSFADALNNASNKIQNQETNEASNNQDAAQTVTKGSSSSAVDANNEEVDQYLGFKIVTEADPAAQAAKDSEDKERARASFENELVDSQEQIQVTDEDGNVVQQRARSTTSAPNQDKLISANFIDGFAQYLVENYTELSKNSPLEVSSYYGANLKDLPKSAGLEQSREFIMGYLYNVETLDRLHQAYEDQFLAAYNEYANSPLENGSSYTNEQRKRMNAFYANYASTLAQVLLAVSSLQNFDEQMAKIYAAETNLKNVRNSFAKTQVDFDEARYANKSTALLAKQLKDLATQIQQSSDLYKVEERELVASIMQISNVSLSSGDLLYLCKWLARRKAQIANTTAWRNTNRELASIFSNISVKLKQ